MLPRLRIPITTNTQRALARSSASANLRPLAIVQRNMATLQPGQPAPTARPPSWKALGPPASLSPTSPFTASDRLLPHLPVPPLPQTLDRLLRSAGALARSDAELSELERKVSEFGKPGGLGERLQARLVERRDGEGRSSWLEEWWDDGAYMAYRDSVVINVSYFYGFYPPKEKLSVARYAAQIVRSALLFRRAMLRGELQPDTVGKAKQPICMDSYRFMFDASRIPSTSPADYVAVHRSPSSTSPVHVAVAHKGLWWALPATHGGEPDGGDVLETEEIEGALEEILRGAEGREDEAGVGALTAQDRDSWAADRARLLSSPPNAPALHALESAAFTLSLDASSPTPTPAGRSRHLWHAGERAQEVGNRWMDKPVQFIVWEDKEGGEGGRGVAARAGMMGEHSAIDGTPTVRLCDALLTTLSSPSFFSSSPSSPTTTSTTSPTQITFDLTPVRTSLPCAHEAFRALVDSQVLGYVRTRYGKAEIKRAGFSPDAWTQMVVQLAYSKLSPHPVGTYEAAQTRTFQRGRTECVRSASPEAVLWTSAMKDPASSVEERRKLFREAVERHGANMGAAGKGEGCDRHLFGLRKLLREGEKAELFEDPLYQRSGHWTLSTSQIWSPHFELYGWGEVVPDGFGVAYMVGADNHLQFTLTNRADVEVDGLKGQERNDAFARALLEASEEVWRLWLGWEKGEKAGERAKL